MLHIKGFTAVGAGHCRELAVAEVVVDFGNARIRAVGLASIVCISGVSGWTNSDDIHWVSASHHSVGQ